MTARPGAAEGRPVLRLAGDWEWARDGQRLPNGTASHAYTCPLLMTVMGYWQRWVLRRPVRWAWYGPEVEEPLRLVRVCYGRDTGERFGVEVPCPFPKRVILWEHRFWNWWLLRRARRRSGARKEK